VRKGKKMAKKTTETLRDVVEKHVVAQLMDVVPRIFTMHVDREDIEKLGGPSPDRMTARIESRICGVSITAIGYMEAKPPEKTYFIGVDKDVLAFGMDNDDPVSLRDIIQDSIERFYKIVIRDEIDFSKEDYEDIEGLALRVDATEVSLIVRNGPQLRITVDVHAE